MRFRRISPSVHAATIALVGISFVTGDLRILARENLALDRFVLLARTGHVYQPATPSELAHCEELFLQTFRDPQIPGLEDEWRQLGFRLLRVGEGRSEALILVEPPKQKRGWGCYVICPQRLPGMVLQAPHSYADRYTDHIALRLFADGEFAAAAWNTVPRKTVDVAHTPNHPFSAFTRALIRAHPESWVVQVHGFSQDKRQTVAGNSADLIVSDGTRAPSRTIRRLAVMLQSDFPYGQIQLFPTEVQELGATRNTQGELLRQTGSTHFMHLEMSQDLRLRLVNDPHARRLLLKNLADCVD